MVTETDVYVCAAVGTVYGALMAVVYACVVAFQTNAPV